MPLFNYIEATSLNKKHQSIYGVILPQEVLSTVHCV